MRLHHFFTVLVTIAIGFSFGASAANSKQEPTKAVLITGASSGLGLKMTEVLSNSGFFVYAGARDQDDLARLEAMDNVESIRLDVTVQSDIDAAVATVKAKGRGLYGLINNAGLSIFGPMIEVPVEQMDFLFDVNVRGPYRVTQAFAPMLAVSKGRLVTTGSIAGAGVNPMMGHYSMSKYAVEAMTDAWAQELAPMGIRVAVIEPGAFGTNIGNAALERLKQENYWPETSQYAEFRANYFAALANFDKGADPLPVAEAALHFMSSDAPKARYMVTPDQGQATRTIARLLSRVVEQNQDQVHSLTRDQIIELLDAELEKIDAE